MFLSSHIGCVKNQHRSLGIENCSSQAPDLILRRTELFYVCHPKHGVMTKGQDLKCFICGLAVAESEAKTHSSTSSHGAQKQKLEQELDAVKNDEYAGDSSVIHRWTSSI